MVIVSIGLSMDSPETLPRIKLPEGISTIVPFNSGRGSGIDESSSLLHPQSKMPDRKYVIAIICIALKHFILLWYCIDKIFFILIIHMVYNYSATGSKVPPQYIVCSRFEFLSRLVWGIA
jgi:hypothetical protein